jgi:hypothetical protein
MTFFTRIKPDVNPMFYNWTFIDDPRSYYRVDILGSEYPFSHGGKKADIIIQQFDDSNVTPHASEKVYLSYADMQGYGGWHEGYKMKIPCTLMLFNDKLYTPDLQPPIVVNPPDNDPIINNPPDQEPPNTPGVPPSTPPDQPYFNFGGDTTDTGASMGPTDYQPIDLYNYKPSVGEYYIPWWRKWFRYQ